MSTWPRLDIEEMAARARTSGEYTTLQEVLRRLDRLDALERMPVMYVLRRVDGEPLHGELTFVIAKDEKDWSSAEIEWECLDGDDLAEAEIEMLRCRMESVERRLPPSPVSYDCWACLRADHGAKRGGRVVILCPECDSPDCPKATAHVNVCQG